MMGLGYLSGGVSSSSSSSSNLSPLAPPFTVDRSNPKPNSNPSLAHFNESPYPVPFTSPLQNWPYSRSSSSRPDFLVDSIRTTSVPSTTDYGYVGSQPINQLSTHWSASNPNVKPGSESINPPGAHWSSLNPSPENVSDSFSYLGDAKPYYTPYVSSVVKDEMPLVALNEPSYDFLSTSGLVPADGSSRVDYTQSLSGLEYTPQWEGIWNAPAEGKRGKRMEADESFFSEDVSIAGSLAYKNYVKQGAIGAEILSKSKEDSMPTLGNYADLIGRENQIGPLSTGKLADKSLTAKNLGLAPIELSKAQSFRAFPVFPESRPSPEPSRGSWENQKPTTLYEKRFQMFDACMNDSISVTKSPPLMIKPPAVGTSLTVADTTSYKKVEVSNIAAMNGNDDVGRYNPFKEKETFLLPSSEAKEGFLATNQLSFQLGRNDQHTFVASFSPKQEMPYKLPTNNDLDDAFQGRSGFQVSDINVPDVDGNETVKSAEDSPCWKGAPNPHFSAFEAAEAATPQHLMKKLQSNGMNLQGAQIIRSNHSPQVSSQDLCEKTVQNENVCVDNGFSLSPKKTSAANLTETELKLGDAVNAGFDSAKPSSSKGLQSSNCTVKARDGLLHESNSDADSKTSHPKLQNFKEDVSRSKRKLPSQVGVVDHATHAVETVLLSSAEDAAKPATAAKVNVQMLVKALNKLSELLVFHCSSDVLALKEQDRAALDHVIGNLDACMSRKTVQGAPTQLLPEQGTSDLVGKCARDEKRTYDLVDEKVEKQQNFVSLRDDADLMKDHNMVQAIKRVLDENLQCKDELQSQSLLYKNLWLEAEAELCAISYRARYERMKREMEKCKLDRTKGIPENAVPVEKLSSSKVSPNPSITDKLTTEVDANLISNTSIQDSFLPSPHSHVDDVEASVMARFHILKCRGEPNPVNVKEQEPAEVADAGVAGKGSQSSDVNTLGLGLHHHTGKGNEENFGFCPSDPDHETMEGFCVCAADDAVVTMQPHGNNMMQNQFVSGWYNSSYSSSDWEHVLKDEFAWQN